VRLNDLGRSRSKADFTKQQSSSMTKEISSGMILRLEARSRRVVRRLKAFLGRPRVVLQTNAIPITQIEPCRSPIFLIGVNRSGTSLCRRIIDSHSRIACPPETFFLLHFASMIGDPRFKLGFEGLGFGGALGLGDRGLVLKEIRKWSSMYHEAYRVARGKARWADKTPDYVRILPELEEIFGPDAQYVMIFRHPLETVCSSYARGWRLSWDDPDLLVSNAKYLVENAERQLAFARQFPCRCFRLYYEDLVQNPEQTLRAVFNFLGEPWEPAVLEYDRLEHNFGAEDPVAWGMRGFNLNWGSFRALKTQQLETVVPILRDVSAQLGYSLEDLSVPEVKSGIEEGLLSGSLQKQA
jgi:hypothetical protein